MNVREWMDTFFTEKRIVKLAKCLVAVFVLPLLVLFLFRWLLNELFSWNLPKPPINFKLPKEKRQMRKWNLNR